MCTRCTPDLTDFGGFTQTSTFKLMLYFRARFADFIKFAEVGIHFTYRRSSRVGTIHRVLSCFDFDVRFPQSPAWCRSVSRRDSTIKRV